jgi:PleD family two-component response regulator
MPRAVNRARLSQPTLFHPPDARPPFQTLPRDIQEKTMRLLPRLLIPIVLLTGLTKVEDRVRGIDAGADDFLTKPFVIAELNARVRSLTRMKRYTDELDSSQRKR